MSVRRGFQDSVGVLERELQKATSALAKEKDSHKMTWSCLNMVKKTLIAAGELKVDESGSCATPPYSFNDAVHNAIARRHVKRRQNLLHALRYRRRIEDLEGQLAGFGTGASRELCAALGRSRRELCAAMRVPSDLLGAKEKSFIGVDLGTKDSTAVVNVDLDSKGLPAIVSVEKGEE